MLRNQQSGVGAIDVQGSKVETADKIAERILAYKWLNLAASRASGPKKEYSFRMRDSVATKMSSGQIERAQALLLAWRPAPEIGVSAYDRVR